MPVVLLILISARNRPTSKFSEGGQKCWEIDRDRVRVGIPQDPYRVWPVRSRLITFRCTARKPESCTHPLCPVSGMSCCPMPHGHCFWNHGSSKHCLVLHSLSVYLWHPVLTIVVKRALRVIVWLLTSDVTRGNWPGKGVFGAYVPLRLSVILHVHKTVDQCNPILRCRSM